MTAPKPIEIRVAASLLDPPPAPGDIFVSKSGKSYLSISRVRRSGEKVPTFRLIGMRLRSSDLPLGATVRPWPKKPVRAAPGAAEGPILKPMPRQSRAAARNAQRARTMELLADDRDSNRVVHQVRIVNGTALTGEWVDPDDLNPRRREAKRIHGYRARDQITILEDAGTLGKQHAKAMRRFRRLHDEGVIGLSSGKPLIEERGGTQFASGGPSETRLLKLHEYNQVVSAVGTHLTEILLAIIIGEVSISAYAARKRMNRSTVAGYLLAAVDATMDWFDRVDKEGRETH